MQTVLVATYEAPPVSRKEILRYAGAHEALSELSTVLDECLAEALPLLGYSVCYTELPVKASEGGVDLGCFVTESRDLAKAMSGCSSAIVFAATVGLSLDRLISRYAVQSPTKALLFQAIGAERIEALCDVFCRELAENDPKSNFRPRFSPGYGDFPLTAQRDIFAILDCPKRIGLSLNQSLLLSPTKSVTAVIGKEQRTK